VHPDRNLQNNKIASDSFDKVFKAYSNLSEMGSREVIVQQYAEYLLEDARKRETDQLDYLVLPIDNMSSKTATKNKHHSHINGDSSILNVTQKTEEMKENKKREFSEMQKSDKIDETHNILKHLNKKRKMKQEMRQNEAQSFENEMWEDLENRRRNAQMQNIRRQQLMDKMGQVILEESHHASHDNDSADDFETKFNRIKAKQNSKKRRNRFGI